MTHSKSGGTKKLMQIYHSLKLLKEWMGLTPLPFDYEATLVSASKKKDEELALRKCEYTEYDIYDE